MRPMFAVQVTSRDDAELHKTIEALKQAGLDYETFGVIPFEYEITNLEAFPTDRPVIPLCGTKVLDMWLKKLVPENWHLFYNEHHMDQAYAERFYGTQLLNYWCELRVFDEAKDLVWDYPRFVKPVDDRKAFGGLVLDAGESLAQALEKMTHQPIDPAQGVLISDLQNLGREFRMFVVDGEVIDIAEYRNSGHVQHKKVYAQDADKLRAYHKTVHHPTAPRAYVMDVCEVVEDVTDLRIVELNCLNCSGPYTVDRAQVYSAVAKAV